METITRTLETLTAFVKQVKDLMHDMIRKLVSWECLKKSILPVSLFLLLSSQLSAQHFIEKGSMRIGVEVVLKGINLPIDSLCEGFDPVTNHPINLIIPENSSILITRDSTISSGNYLVNSRNPRYINEPMRKSGFNLSSSPGSAHTYTFINDITSDSLSVSWKVDYANIELVDLFPSSYFSDYLSFQFQILFEEYPDTSQYDWAQEEYITELDARGLPIWPKFPHADNGLLFVPGEVTEDAFIYLKGYHEQPQPYNEDDPFGLFIYEDLPVGHYEFIVRPYKDAPDSKSLIYPFTILKPWWLKTPALIGFTFLLTLTLGGLFFLIYRRRQRKRETELRWKQQLSEAELKAIRAQLNPHFLFNALSSIQNLVTQQKNEVANTYLTKLSRLLRNVLSASEHTFHELRSELALVELYLELEKLRFPFEYEIKINEKVNQDSLTPVMLLQPFVENAIKHGIAGREDGKVVVNIHTINGSLVIEILDNGPGLSKPKANSTGLQLSKDRIGPLNDLYGKETTIEIANRTDQNGVCVRITLPIE
ncbi:MAG: histidine kinase [Ekhidna sp.]